MLGKNLWYERSSFTNKLSYVCMIFANLHPDIFGEKYAALPRECPVKISFTSDKNLF